MKKLFLLLTVIGVIVTACGPIDNSSKDNNGDSSGTELPGNNDNDENDEDVILNNHIWYTSSDGAVVEPYLTDVFGANIVSNTYENGQGVITFDGNVTSIGEYAFYNCDNLTSVTIGNSVTSIKDGAFYNCRNLTSVTIGNSVTSIGNMAFSWCVILTSITIPNSVTEIGETVFYGCSGLEAFYGKFTSSDNRCLVVNGVLNSFAPDGLTEYTIPNSVTEIGYGAFSGFSSLTSVIITDGITSIGDYAFSSCSSLKNITIPDSITSIGQGVFLYCRGLTNVYCKPTTPPVGDRDMFDDNASGRKIYVPRNSVEAYKSAEYWSEYADYIEGYDF